MCRGELPEVIARLTVCEAGESGRERGVKETDSPFPCCPGNLECS